MVGCCVLSPDERGHTGTQRRLGERGEGMEGDRENIEESEKVENGRDLPRWLMKCFLMNGFSL